MPGMNRHLMKVQIEIRMECVEYTTEDTELTHKNIAQLTFAWTLFIEGHKQA